MELIRMQHITKTYSKQKITALCDFDLTVEEGEMVAVMGRSGSGKSTVVNLIAGIDRLESGKYYFAGRDMSGLSGDQFTVFRRENIGVVLQHFALIDDYTVFQNIALPLKLRRCSKAEIRQKVNAIAKELEISALLQKYPRELSGGEAQRTAIARAVITEPKLILADEPTGALDEETGRKIMEVFRGLHEKGNTLLIVTHDADVAQMCDRTVKISRLRAGSARLHNRDFGILRDQANCPTGIVLQF